MTEFYIIATYDIASGSSIYLKRLELGENTDDLPAYFAHHPVWTKEPELATRFSQKNIAERMLEIVPSGKLHEIQKWRESVTRVAEGNES